MSTALVEAFHRGIYWDAFAAQHEPLDVWLRALRGELPYALTVHVERDGDAIVGGIAYELYPASQCGLVTYLVVAPAARQRGLGRRLLDGAVADLRARGARAVFGEVNADAPARLARFVRWGATVLDVPYVQPALGPGLAPDRGLVLIAFGPPPPRAVVDAFLADFAAVLARP